MSARAPYASPAAALRFPGRAKKVGSGEYKDRRDTEPNPGCECKSYIDILTRGRWNACGRWIQAGEHAHFHGGRQKNVPLFCRCQLAPEVIAITNTDAGIPGFEDVEGRAA